jgi:hypothetical protein
MMHRNSFQEEAISEHFKVLVCSDGPGYFFTEKTTKEIRKWDWPIGIS